MQEPHLSFNDALLKVEWADQHIDDLETVYKRFQETNRQIPLVETKRTRKGSSHNFIGLEMAPVEITLRVGDIIRNLRGALDYCWTGLDRAIDPFSKNKPTLPIGDNRKGAENTALQTAVGQAFPTAAKLVADVIGCHADFRDNGNRPILIINRLSNWEKHNLLILTVTQVRTGKFFAGGMTFSDIIISDCIGDAISIEGHGDNDVKGNLNATGEIVFGKHDFVENEPIFPLIRNLSEAARKAVEDFTEAFPIPTRT